MNNGDGRTPAEFADVAAQRGITWWPIRDCSICGVPIGYEFDAGGGVGFSSECACSSYSGWTRRTWVDVAEHYNRQQHPVVVAKYEAFWFGEDPS